MHKIDYFAEGKAQSIISRTVRKPTRDAMKTGFTETDVTDVKQGKSGGS